MIQAPFTGNMGCYLDIKLKLNEALFGPSSHISWHQPSVFREAWQERTGLSHLGMWSL